MKTLDKSGLLEAIFASAEDYAIIVVSPEGKIATWNNGAAKVFGYGEDEILGQPVGVLFTQEDRLDRIPQQELATARAQGRALDYRWHLRKDGTCFWADGVMSPMYGSDGELAGYVKILRDATEKREAELEIARLARIDPLTGLANRAEFDSRFIDMTAAASRHRQMLILLLIDLDHFKQINDRFGHQAGDRLLKQAAQRIRETVRETDFVARVGGDEFVVLQPDAGSADVGGTVADKLVATLSNPFQIGGLQMRIGASIGISVYPQDATDPDQLLRKADLALYKVKAEARNGYHYFSQELDEQAYRRSRALSGLRRAMANQDFSVYYQPKVEASTGRVVAVEALLRCHERVLAEYPIDEVIDLAMEAGVMEHLGLSVLTEACAQVCKWHDAGMTHLELCVNLCASEMADPQLSTVITGALGRCGLAPELMVVELTEREIFDSGETGLAILSELRASGVRVAIDDFGTGYSSLSYLNDLPIDIIKLDRSFLRNIPGSEQDRTVARAIVTLAHGLELQVVAEGIETQEQADFFLGEHCDLLQGYLFSPPLPADEMTSWLLARANANLLAPPHAPQSMPRH